MSGGLRQLKKGEYLFREGDPSDAMYVIKKGRIGIMKSKGNSEVTLAELMPGEMLGEMAFFDNKPRSASAKAVVDSDVIALPFTALLAQFKTFPEWLRAMVKTVNSHLRNANQTIKNLQSTSVEDEEMFPPHTITRFCAILTLVGFKEGQEEEVEGTKGLVVPSTTLRNYTIQVFQQPTYKMDKLLEILSNKGYCKVEDIGEGRKKTTLYKHKELTDFTDWYNKYLFTEESKRITIEDRELPQLKALVFYGAKAEKGDDGKVTVNLTDIKNESMKDLNYVVDATAMDTLIEKGLCEDKQLKDDQVTMTFNYDEVTRIYPFWDLVYTLLKVPKR